MSDRTFQLDSVPSYGAHIELVSTTTDGFAGDGPDRSPVPMTHSKLTPRTSGGSSSTHRRTPGAL